MAKPDDKHSHKHDDDKAPKPYDPPAITTRAADPDPEPTLTYADEQRQRSSYYEENLGEISGGGEVARDADGKFLDEDRREALERDGHGNPVSNRKPHYDDVGNRKGVVAGVGWDDPQGQPKKK